MGLYWDNGKENGNYYIISDTASGKLFAGTTGSKHGSSKKPSRPGFDELFGIGCEFSEGTFISRQTQNPKSLFPLRRIHACTVGFLSPLGALTPECCSSSLVLTGLLRLLLSSQYVVGYFPHSATIG